MFGKSLKWHFFFQVGVGKLLSLSRQSGILRAMQRIHPVQMSQKPPNPERCSRTGRFLQTPPFHGWDAELGEDGRKLMTWELKLNAATVEEGAESQRCGLAPFWIGSSCLPGQNTPTPPNPLVNACILQEEAETERLQMQATRSGDDSTTPTRITTTCKHGLTENCTLYKACNIVSPIDLCPFLQRHGRGGTDWVDSSKQCRLSTGCTHLRLGVEGETKQPCFIAFVKKGT